MEYYLFYNNIRYILTKSHIFRYTLYIESERLEKNPHDFY